MAINLKVIKNSKKSYQNWKQWFWDLKWTLMTGKEDNPVSINNETSPRKCLKIIFITQSGPISYLLCIEIYLRLTDPKSIKKMVAKWNLSIKRRSRINYEAYLWIKKYLIWISPNGETSDVASMWKRLCRVDEGFLWNDFWEQNKLPSRESFPSFLVPFKALKLFARKFTFIAQYSENFQEQPLQSNESYLISTSKIITQVDISRTLNVWNWYFQYSGLRLSLYGTLFELFFVFKAKNLFLTHSFIMISWKSSIVDSLGM